MGFLVAQFSLAAMLSLVKKLSAILHLTLRPMPGAVGNQTRARWWNRKIKIGASIRMALLAFCSLLLLPGPLFSEIVFLKNGSVKTGTIQSETDTEIRLQLTGRGATADGPSRGLVVIPRQNILRVSYSASSLVEKYVYDKDGRLTRGFVVSENAEAITLRPVLNEIKEVTIYRSDIDIIAARPVTTDGGKKPDPLNEVELQLGAGLFSTGNNSDNIAGSEKITPADFPVGFKAALIYSRTRLPLQALTRYSRLLNAWGAMQFYGAGQTFNLLNGGSEAEATVTYWALSGGLGLNLPVATRLSWDSRVGFGVQTTNTQFNFDSSTSTVVNAKGKQVEKASTSSQSLLLILQSGLSYDLNYNLRIGLAVDISFSLYDATLAGNYGLTSGVGYSF